MNMLIVKGDNEQVIELEEELQFTKKGPRSTVKELETSNEELTSTCEFWNAPSMT